MALYRVLNSIAVRWEGEPINGVKHPLNIENKWAEKELSKIGLYKPLPPDDIPDGKISVGRVVKYIDGSVKWVHILKDNSQVTATSEEVNEERARRIAHGAKFNVTGIETKISVTGRPEDMDTLLALVTTAQIRLSQNDDSITQYRDGNNIDHMLSPAQIIELWTQSMDWVERVYKASWDIKAMTPIPSDYKDQFDLILGV